MNSLEKLRNVLTELTDTAPGEDVHPLELLLRTTLQMVGPTIDQIVAEHDPDMIDDYLEWFAVKTLQCRSDGAEPLRLAHELVKADPGVVSAPLTPAAQSPQGIVPPHSGAFELPAGE
jgi:hypothetical protein